MQQSQFKSILRMTDANPYAGISRFSRGLAKVVFKLISI